MAQMEQDMESMKAQLRLAENMYSKVDGLFREGKLKQDG